MTQYTHANTYTYTYTLSCYIIIRLALLGSFATPISLLFLFLLRFPFHLFVQSIEINHADIAKTFSALKNLQQHYNGFSREIKIENKEEEEMGLGFWVGNEKFSVYLCIFHFHFNFNCSYYNTGNGEKQSRNSTTNIKSNIISFLWQTHFQKA